MKSKMKCLTLFFFSSVLLSAQLHWTLSPTTRIGKVYSHHYSSFSYSEQYEQPGMDFPLNL